MESILRDLRYGLKLLLRDCAFSLTVLITLGVSTGANIAIFSVIHAVALRPLPFMQPDRLVTMYNMYPGAGVQRGGAMNSSPDFFFRRERVEGLVDVAAYQLEGDTVGEAGNTDRLSSLRVTPSFFSVLGVDAALGRTLVEEEMEADREPTVILTYGYWQDRLGGSPDVIGQTLRIDGAPATIVGVLREDFRMPEHPEIRLVRPLSFSPAQRNLQSWHSNNYAMLGRLAPGATVTQVEAQISALNSSLTDQCPIPNCRQLLEDIGFRTVVVDARDDLIRDIKPALLILWGGAIVVLLIACVNIANLMLARSQVRLRELATRMALGAQRSRLSRQMLTEAWIMALLGAMVGVGLGVLGLRLLAIGGMENLPRAEEIGVNGSVLLYTVALATGTAVLFAAIPIARLVRSDLSCVYREETRSGTASRADVLLRGGLGAGQVALAFVLLAGAGLLLRSFQATVEVDPGFTPEKVLTGYVALVGAGYTDGGAWRGVVDEILGEARALPGVTAASVTDSLPFGSGDASNNVIIPEGYQPGPGESLLAPWSSIVGPGYFEAMGIELVEGRTFEDKDAQDQPRAIIIDEWLARRYWPGRSPLGQRMVNAVPDTDVREEDLHTVIGVVRAIKQRDLTAPEGDHVGAYYFTYRQRPISNFAVVIRSATDPTTLTGPLRASLARLNPELAPFDVQTLENRLAESLASRRVSMTLLLVFSGIAMFLAVVGIYGVLAYSVAQRTREFGIRMALGGQPREIRRLVLKQGFILIVLGLAVGGIAAFFLEGLMRPLLFGVQPADPLVLAVTTGLLCLSGISASMIPARRATASIRLWRCAGK